MWLTRGYLPSLSAESTGSTGSATEADMAHISPEALKTLSADQVQTLVTSNSVNYDVIQQIMAQKQHQSSPGSEGTGESPTKEDAAMATAESENQAGEPSSSQPPVVHITPEQLKQLQIQVGDSSAAYNG